LLPTGEIRYPDLVEGNDVVGGWVGEPRRQDALVQLAVVRGLDRHKDLVVVQAAELVGQGLQDGRVVANLVEEQGPDDGGPRRGRGADPARASCAGIEQRRQGDATANPDAEAQAAVEEGSPAVPA